MSKTTLKSKSHRVLAHIEIDSRGVHRITDHGHKTLGYYDPRTNRTTDRNHRLVGYGYQLPRLIPADLAEEGGAGTIQPQPPLSPKQSRARAERQQRIQQQVQQEKTRSAEKLRDLRTKLAKT
ncbi:hypothetical protein [Microvirga makkahensis]|uniref:Uncharacterized protein n=1 Tax=Microvirga makkahensis TaxID=1128670 RepID=A0A7X3MPR0_9HYPH|nr:hypothetical protein [Microvirga makkahensis]MXQ10947.1 hypothetical protein [Microvirga makkahensis]